MALTLATATDGLPYFDDHTPPRPLNTDGVTYLDQDGAVVLGFGGPPQDAHGATIPQPAMGVRVAALVRYVHHTTATAFGAGAAAGPIVVARTPARVSRQPIDYSNKSGSSLFDRATKNMFASADERYDLNADGLMDFTDAVARRGKECGWDLFTIPNSAGVNKNLISQYGELTLAEVHDWVNPIVTAVPLTRQAQEDAQLYLCLMNSLSKGAIGELMLKEADFTIGDEGCGVKLFRIIMSESQVDTVATTNLLLGQLTSGLPELMEKHGNNIKAFNNEVKTIVRRVKRWGTDPGSILPQLLRVYRKVEDKSGAFFRYIENLNNNYTDGHTALTDMTLMDKALTKYEELSESKEFESKDNKDDTILSLETKVKHSLE